MSKKSEEKVLEEVLSVLFLPVLARRVLDYNLMRNDQFLCDSVQRKIYGIRKHDHDFGPGITLIFSFSNSCCKNT